MACTVLLLSITSVITRLVCPIANPDKIALQTIMNKAVGAALHSRGGSSARMYRELGSYARTTETRVSITSCLPHSFRVSSIRSDVRFLPARCLTAFVLDVRLDYLSVSFIGRGALVLSEAIVLGVTWRATYRQARDSTWAGRNNGSFAAILLRTGEQTLRLCGRTIS